jgi:non-canonical poly(A) RNA polymerase PAPD5/7
MLDPRLVAFSESVKVQPSSNPSVHCPWCQGNEYEHELSDLRLHRELLDFTTWISPTDFEKHLRLVTIIRFRTAVSLLWPEAHLICHGSTATWTNLPVGDLDFVVCNGPDNIAALSALGILNRHLIDCHIIERSRVIPARCPIVKGTEFPFGFSVDISLNNENGVMNIERHRNYLKVFPSLRPLVMLLKCFLYQNELDSPFSGGVSTNTLMQMIVSIIHSAPRRIQFNTGTILLGFLQCFGEHFNYVVTGITTRNGGRLFSRSSQFCLNLKHPVSLCIEDPQSPGLFLGQNAWQAKALRKKCKQAHLRLSRETVGYEQSMLGRVIQPKTVRELMARRAKIERYYAGIVRVESFSLDEKKEQPKREPVRGEVWVSPFAPSKPE